MEVLHTGLKDCSFCKDRKVVCFEILMGRMKENPLTVDMQNNLEDLLVKVGKFREKYGKALTVSSGYRPAAFNATVKGAAKKSAHQNCQAVDFADSDSEVKDFIKKNPTVLVDCDLYMEAGEYTKNWCHLSNRAPKSGKRIFIP